MNPVEWLTLTQMLQLQSTILCSWMEVSHVSSGLILMARVTAPQWQLPWSCGKMPMSAGQRGVQRKGWEAGGSALTYPPVLDLGARLRAGVNRDLVRGRQGLAVVSRT